MSSASTDAPRRVATSEADWSAPVWASAADSSDRPGPRRRRWPWVVAIVAVAVVIVLVATEVVGRRVVTAQVEDRLREAGIEGDLDVEVGTGGLRPVVLPALAGRGVDRVRVRITDGSIGGLPVARADYELRGIDGSVSVTEGTVDVASIDEGRIRIVVPAGALGEAVGTDISIRDGELVAGPRRLRVEPRVVRDQLELTGPASELWGGPVTVGAVDDYLLPCRPSVRIVDVGLELSCTGDRVPGVLRSPLGGIDDSVPGELGPTQTTTRDGG